MVSTHNVALPDAAFEDRLREVLRSRVEFIELIGEDLVAAGGKRTRPLITFLAAQVLGASPARVGWKNVVDLGVCVELLHSASLLHDDLIDDSDTRRGHVTAFRRFGNVVSVMSGDFMLSRLLMLLAQMPGSAALTHAFGQTASVICEGEVLQFQVAAYQEYSRQSYLNVIHGKTAALTELAAMGPALLLGAPEPVREALASFGLEYGMAFQMQDDLLDLLGEEGLIGKPVGGDLREGKPTWPLLDLLDGEHGQEVQEVLERRASHEGDVERVRTLALEGGVLERTRVEIRRRAGLAVAALSALPRSEARDALAELAQREIDRSH